MLRLIPKSFQSIWDSWNIRAIVIFSLSLQIFLILFAPFRKRTSNGLMIFLIWSAYLLADWAANFVVGKISNHTSSSEDQEELLAFWAPFLLVHLGGPDTITAFALEDNELWLRHLIGLILQLIATLYVFIQTLPSDKLLIPTVLLFLSGIIKYAERTRALYLASIGKFKESMLKDPDPGPNYAKLMEEYSSKKEAKVPTRIQLTAEPEKSVFTNTAKDGVLSNFEVVQHAFKYFNRFKGLIVDLIFSFHERNESRDFFHKRTAVDALKVIEVELNFIYEVLYTKVAVVHNWWGTIFRGLSLCAILSGFGVWIHVKKDVYQRFDVYLTYVLLIGAIILDSIAIFSAVFSDWTVAGLNDEMSFQSRILSFFLRCRTPKWSTLNYSKRRWYGLASWPKEAEPFKDCQVMDNPTLFRRWSENVAQFNLITYCLTERSERIYEKTEKSENVWFDWWNMVYKTIDYFGAKEFIDSMLYVKRKPFVKDLWTFIFDQLLDKSREAEDAETTNRICSSRGAYVLQEGTWDVDIKPLLAYIDEVTYDESLILWHIATELCYRKKDSDDFKNTTKDPEFCKLLSDYMLYLLVMQPGMMSAVAGIGQIRFRDTCAETKKFFDRRGLQKENEEKACHKILEIDTAVTPIAVKGDRSKSVLFDAAILSKKLDELKDDKWRILMSVWVEMLAYAGTHCRANTHAQRVSKGGELVTFVWLLMAHFGIGEQFQINEGHGRAKLIVGK